MASVAATVITPTVLGRMCLKMIRRGLAPSARAASTNSFSRSDRNSPRTNRASDVQSTKPRTTASTSGPAPPNRCPSTAAMTSTGIVMMTSVNRINELSTHRP